MDKNSKIKEITEIIQQLKGELTDHQFYVKDIKSKITYFQGQLDILNEINKNPLKELQEHTIEKKLPITNYEHAHNGGEDHTN